MTPDERLTKIEQWLRFEWWSNHGCDPRARYGDDGEMQCNQMGCMMDFRRTPIEELERLVRERRWQMASEAQR